MNPKFGSSEAQMLQKLWRWKQHFKLAGPGVRTTNTDETFSAYIDPPRPSTQSAPEPPPKLFKVVDIVWTDSTPLAQSYYQLRPIDAPTSDLDPTTPATEAAFGVAGDVTTAVLGLNMLEVQVVTDTTQRLINELVTPRTVVGFFHYTNQAGDFAGIPIYKFYGFQPLVCSGS